MNKHWRSKGGESRKNDAFYTKHSIAENCVTVLVNQLYTERKPTVVIEPSAGDGAFVDAAKKQISAARLVAVDISPSAEGIVEKNFYDTSRAYFGIDNAVDRVLLLGNPPFGKNASDAVKFFNHAGEKLRVETIAIIVPRSFKKPSVIDRLDDRYHLHHQEDVPDNSFRFREEKSDKFVDYDVPTVFQIWIRKTEKRAKIVNKKRDSERLENNDFIRFIPKSDVKKSSAQQDFCDMTIQRVGVAAGRVSFDKKYAQEKKDSGNFYFVKVPDAEILSKMKSESAKFSSFLESASGKQDSAGMPSLSMIELLNAVSNYFSNENATKRLKNENDDEE